MARNDTGKVLTPHSAQQSMHFLPSIRCQVSVPHTTPTLQALLPKIRRPEHTAAIEAPVRLLQPCNPLVCLPDMLHELSSSNELIILSYIISSSTLTTTSSTMDAGRSVRHIVL
jgi:hypothetical protein